MYETGGVARVNVKDAAFEEYSVNVFSTECLEVLGSCLGD